MPLRRRSTAIARRRGRDPGLDASAAAGGPPPPVPTLGTIDIDFASANGGESRTWSGCTGVTSPTLTVDGVAATITSYTSTSFTFTVPASSVSTSAGNPAASTVTLTTPGGSVSSSATPGAQLWYVPSYFGLANCALCSAQAVATLAGFIVSVSDLSGNGNVLTPVSGDAPSFTLAGVAGSQSYWSDGTLLSTSYPAMTTGEWLLAGETTGTNSGGLTAVFGLGSVSQVVALAVQQEAAATTLTQYSVNQNVNEVDPGTGTTFSLLSYFDRNSSQQILSGGAPVAGQDPGIETGTGGIFVGGAPIVGARIWPGNTTLVGFYGDVALSTTARANWVAYLHAQGWG